MGYRTTIRRRRKEGEKEKRNEKQTREGKEEGKEKRRRKDRENRKGASRNAGWPERVVNRVQEGIPGAEVVGRAAENVLSVGRRKCEWSEDGRRINRELAGKGQGSVGGRSEVGRGRSHSGQIAVTLRSEDPWLSSAGLGCGVDGTGGVDPGLCRFGTNGAPDAGHPRTDGRGKTNCRKNVTSNPIPIPSSPPLRRRQFIIYHDGS